MSVKDLLDSNDTAQSSKDSFRRPKQARGMEKFNRMLDTAETLILEQSDPGKEFSLYDLADKTGVAVGSVYHFFPSAQAVNVALIERYDSRFAELADQIEEDFDSWQAVVNKHVKLSFEYLKSTPAAQHLLLGPSQSWATRCADVRGDFEIARSMNAAIERQFITPSEQESTDLLFYAIRLLEALWGTSIHLHGELRDEALEQSLIAMHAYLSQYWPEELPRRSSSST